MNRGLIPLVALLVIAGCSIGLYVLVSAATGLKRPYFIWVFSAVAAGIVILKNRSKPSEQAKECPLEEEKE